MGELERSYRRLLWAYPRFYRRHRGLEMVTTMLDAAEPGQTRPTRAEVRHLLLSGLRCRLVPPGWAGKIAAGIVTLWVAVVLSGVGAYVVWNSWQPGSLQPDESVFAGRGEPFRLDSGGHLRDGYLDMAYTYKRTAEFQTFGEEGWTGERPMPVGIVRKYESAGSARAVAADAYQRVRDQGWQTGAMIQPGACDCGVFWASRGDLLLRVLSQSATGGQAVTLVGLYKAEPGGVPAAAAAGFGVGLLLAWPIMTWLVHRFARTPRGDRALMLLFGLPVLYACLANTVDNVLSMVPDPDSSGVLLAADLMYPLANQAANPLAVAVIACGLAASVAVTAVTPWHRRRPAGHSG
jgi:hypothetical protein